VWTLAPLLTLIFLLVAFYFFKVSPVDYTQKSFPSLAIPELENPRALEIKNLKIGWRMNGNIPQLSIQGELSNPTSLAAKSAGVTITLLDENDAPVLIWDPEIPEKVIPPGQHIQFETSADSPPPNATSVTVRLKLAPAFSK
tara:strand:+ start:775 stop:1200 length:426 start_codon:yes stop_codon:yes gene_type:complete